MIQRVQYLEQLTTAISRSPITALFGPRQAGKTTLARLLAENRSATFFDLESQPDVRRLQNPELALASLDGLVIIDEIQVMPELFATLRVLVDRPQNRARFLILGSASPDIVKNVSETLAGRVEFIELGPFDLAEVGAERWRALWVRGGFPRAFLAASDVDSAAWREGFIRTFLSQSLPGPSGQRTTGQATIEAQAGNDNLTSANLYATVAPTYLMSISSYLIFRSSARGAA